MVRSVEIHIQLKDDAKLIQQKGRPISIHFEIRFRSKFDFFVADIPTIFQEKMDQTLENKHPAWLDDIIVVTKGSKQNHTDELIDVL